MLVLISFFLLSLIVGAYIYDFKLRKEHHKAFLRYQRLLQALILFDTVHAKYGEKGVHALADPETIINGDLPVNEANYLDVDKMINLN